jgi:hypothetical protein
MIAVERWGCREAASPPVSSGQREPAARDKKLVELFTARQPYREPTNADAGLVKLRRSGTQTFNLRIALPVLSAVDILVCQAVGDG